MQRKRALISLILLIGIGLIALWMYQTQKESSGTTLSATSSSNTTPLDTLSIDAMKKKSYPGSDLIFEETLVPGPHYNRFVVSYLSDGLKQYGLLTIPQSEKPEKGWPVILFHHGYISPPLYSTKDSYQSFIDPFASSGYIVFKPDYRGNGNSQGIPVQIYVSPDYLTDSMNALSSIKKYKDVNPGKIGAFGHSMGGNITLHELVISKDIKAASIMAGVVGDENGIIDWWIDRINTRRVAGNDLDAANAILHMIKIHKTPDKNPHFWNAIDPTKYSSDISSPVQIQVGSLDKGVPPQFSSLLRDILRNKGKKVDYHEYEGADHNLSPYLSSALKDAVSFFDTYLK